MLRSCLILIGLAVANGELRPTLLFSDNMVLAASSTQPATIFGFASSGEKVTLTANASWLPRQKYTEIAGDDGSWRIDLAPHVPTIDEQSFTLTLQGSKGSGDITAVNVAYGTVLLCSGQSNMALTLGPIYDNETIIHAAHHPEIRLFYVKKAGADAPLDEITNFTASDGYLGTRWVPTTPHSIVQFSAICYLTALELQHGGRGVFGLIDAAVGSTDVQSWMSISARHTALRSCWTPAGASALPPSSSHAPANQTAATWLWNAMVAPLLPFEFSAVLWDQGENNAHYATISEYNCLFASLIRAWREAMGDHESRIPFGFVQLGGYAGGHNVSNIRFAQSDSLPAGSDQIFSNRSAGERQAVDNTAMAPTYDLGSPKPGDPPGTFWIHCRNKSAVARRLARQLAHIWSPPVAAEGAGGAEEWSGPTVDRTVLRTDGSVEVRMAHAAGLELRGGQGCVLCCDQATPPERGDAYMFEFFDDARGEWLAATGSVLANGSVLVRPHANAAGRSASAVRYGVTDIPQCVLYNAAELPAVPFAFPVPYVVRPGRDAAP